MKLLRLLAVAALFALAPAGATAQQDDGDAGRRNQLTLDVSWVGGSLGYARRTGPDDLLGLAVGGAGWWLASEHFGDDHFDDGDLLGVVHGAPFWRHELGDRFEVDVGVQLGFVIHGTGSGDNAALGLFGGPYVAPMFGWRDVKFGPRVFAGWAYEADDAKGFGFVVDPITARVVLRF